MKTKDTTWQILLLLFCLLAYKTSLGQTKKENYTEYIDKYGVSIRLPSDLHLAKPVDRNFWIENFNSKLIILGIDSPKNNIQVIISEIKMREKSKSYEVKIISYLLSDQKRPISKPLTRVYEMRLMTKNKGFYIKEFNYELMEW